MSKKVSVKSFIMSALRLITKVLGFLSGLFLVIMSLAWVSSTNYKLSQGDISPWTFSGILVGAIILTLGAIMIAIGEFKLSDDEYDYEGTNFFEKMFYYIFKKRLGHLIFSIGLILLTLFAAISLKVVMVLPMIIFFACIGAGAFNFMETAVYPDQKSKKEYIREDTNFYIFVIVITILLWLTKSPIFF
ncbi:hypothetical protein SDC9_76785 [bioreactor metagenome]|uniref:Uncharacterized protein n=1 Tax=bioreactor metagenome TaxID=1076179 RepID=A0A644YPN0_9ZZZZ